MANWTCLAGQYLTLGSGRPSEDVLRNSASPFTGKCRLFRVLGVLRGFLSDFVTAVTDVRCPVCR